MFKRLLLFIIRLYQIMSSTFPQRCRFYPSCSSYAYQAIRKYNLLYAIWLIAKRLSRCHPFHPGGIDYP